MFSSFESRSLINGNMLSKFEGKNISIMLKVEDEAGTNVNAVTTDGKKVRVSMPEPLGARRNTWVEIIGTSAGADCIRGKEAILFSQDNVDFDEEGYNMMVLFMNNCKDIFRSG